MQKIKLQFQCDQDVGDMSVDSNGKPFCRLCQRGLNDFREKSLEEVYAYISQNKGCGIFNSEHIAEIYIPILSATALRKYLLAISTIFVTEISSAQISDTVDLTKVITNNKRDAEVVTEEVKRNTKRENRRRSRNYAKNRKPSRVDYGLFLIRKFPFVTFKAKFYPRYSTSWWHDQYFKDHPQKANGFRLFFRVPKNKIS